ncbi:MAG: hypothetical protein A2Y17_08365 [Clostridiales bacterium GWF2_38_85]|nr:MAG: hypothetical protein A2Y17_08365 [Clostridiales bacterium GWF2_38_85]HBL83794.1 peptidase [Clostridiales bacterium]
MIDTERLKEFVDSPDTVAFIVQNSVYFIEYLKDKPYILPTKVLTGDYLVAYTKKGSLKTVISNIGSYFTSSESIVLGLLDKQALEASGIIQMQQQPYLNLRGQGVLVGIIDTGIDYTNEVFKYEDGSSKIKAIYDQTLRGIVPYELPFGIEYTQEEINSALKSDNPLSIVPETDTSGHGTFLASIAAGRELDNFIGAAPDSELLIVKLKKASPYYYEKWLIPPEQEHAYESISIMIGIEYILKKSQELGRPVVICIGLGTNLGGHNGFSLFEDYLSGISKITGVCICIAAGNESQAKHHTNGYITETNQVQNIELKVSENSSDIFINTWNYSPDRLSVSIRSPTGEKINRIPVKSGVRYEAKLILERSTVIVEYIYPTRGLGGQATIIKILKPTTGVWIITIHGDYIVNGEYHSYLPITGFVSPGVEFLTPTPNYTILIPGTAVGVITCGAYNSLDNTLFIDSSWGPTRLPAMSPDLVAPGVNVGGFYPYGYGLMSGTSVAAAITAGACALMLQWGIVEGNDIALSTSQIKAYLIRGATRIEGTIFPNTQWGYGKLNLVQSFNVMR